MPDLLEGHRSGPRDDRATEAGEARGGALAEPEAEGQSGRHDSLSACVGGPGRARGADLRGAAGAGARRLATRPVAWRRAGAQGTGAAGVGGPRTAGRGTWPR